MPQTQQKPNMVTTQGPDHCNLHILEHSSKDKQTELEETGHRVVVKTEGNNDSMSVDEDMGVTNEDDNNVDDFVKDPLKYESAPFKCTLCLEEFVYEHAYMQHNMSMHLQGGDGDGKCDTSQICKPHTAVSSSSSHSSLITEHKQADPSPEAHATRIVVAPLLTNLMTDNKNKVEVKEEVDRAEKFIEIDIDLNYQAASENAAPTTHDKHFDNNRQNVNDKLMDPLKYESASFQCTLCMEEFVHEHLYMRHMNMHLQQGGDGDGECDTSQVCKPHTAVSSSPSHSSLITENKLANPSSEAHTAHTLGAPLPAILAKSYEIKVPPTEQDGTTEKVDANNSCQYKRLTDCFVELYNVYRNFKKVDPRDGSQTKTRKGARSCGSQNVASKDITYQPPSQNKVPTTECITPVTGSSRRRKVKVLKTLQSETDCLNNVTYSLQNSLHTRGISSSYTCDICHKNYKRKCVFVKHVKAHTEVQPFTCETCQYKCKTEDKLSKHMLIHTGEKPYSCNLCMYKCAQKCSLTRHMKTHTGEKPFSCTLCEYRCVSNSKLVRHMKTHTGTKPFSCKLCDYKCIQNSTLVTHMRTHTGEKPYYCKLCEYKCARNSDLVSHMRIHTGEKPYSCEICECKCAHKSSLLRHMRNHTGEKPFSCTICEYKCVSNNKLATHMRTHTGVKPYSCKLCEHKCADKSNLVRHMRTHTSEKPSPVL